MTDNTDRTFEYLLNRMERAAKAENPAEAGYAAARAAVLAYVRGLEALRDDVRTLQIAADHHGPLMSVDTRRVWILAHSDYDEYTIIGVYDSEALAEAERDRVEALQVEHGDAPRRRSRRDGHCVVEAFDLNRTGVEVIVRVRKDGEVKETHVSVGYRSVSQNYERTYEGRGESYEDALGKALRAASEPSA